jgi:hypothetical protein
MAKPPQELFLDRPLLLNLWPGLGAPWISINQLFFPIVNTRKYGNAPHLWVSRYIDEGRRKLLESFYSQV